MKNTVTMEEFEKCFFEALESTKVLILSYAKAGFICRLMYDLPTAQYLVIQHGKEIKRFKFRVDALNYYNSIMP